MTGAEFERLMKNQASSRYLLYGGNLHWTSIAFARRCFPALQSRKYRNFWRSHPEGQKLIHSHSLEIP